jgi:hypothetical protein
LKNNDDSNSSRKSWSRSDHESPGPDIESTLSPSKQLPGTLLTARRHIPATPLDFSRPFTPPEKELVPCAAEVLDSANMLEIIRDGGGQQARLLYWNRQQSVTAEQFESRERRYAPTASAKLIQHLPSHPAPYSDTQVLFSAVAEFIEKNSGLGGQDAAQLALFAFSSFFSECLSISPCLLLFGAPLQAVSLLRVLSCICRHPVLSIGSSVLGLSPELQPTRLICQGDARVYRQLPALQFHVFSMIDPQPRQISGASVIYAADVEPKTPFVEACLQLYVPPNNRSFGLREEGRQAATIQNLQNQLLMYRLQNYDKVKASEFDIPEFIGATREYVRALGQCLVDAPELQASLAIVFRSRDDAERTEMACELDAVVVEALVVCCHERKSSVHVGEIATLANGILSLKEESIELSARQVGGRLKNLGFRTTRLGSGGRGVYLLNAECERIHKHGRALGVASLREGLSGCRFCKQEDRK